jgi:hypothetical protein
MIVTNYQEYLSLFSFKVSQKHVRALNIENYVNILKLFYK